MLYEQALLTAPYKCVQTCYIHTLPIGYRDDQVYNTETYSIIC